MVKKGALTGLLLFGIFFGAGNLIFPPALGAQSGENFWLAISGFILSGVGIAVLTLIIGSLNINGYQHEFSTKISPVFATVFLSAIYLTIGPFFAIPRTATTSFSVGIAPMLNQYTISIAGLHLDLGLLIYTLIYFAIAYAIALNPSKILNTVGRVLTPIFAGLIILLVILGIIKYSGEIGSVAAPGYDKLTAFGSGFLEGYNTLDALASVAFSVVVVNTLKQLGFKNKKEYISTVWVVGIVVSLAFSILYIGLGYLGNKFPIPVDAVIDNVGVYVLSQATQSIFGSGAQLFLALMVIVTCFTTTVGLIVSISEFFNQIYDKISYKVYVTAFTLIGLSIANLGLNAIISFSIPVLIFLYPITITLVLIVIVNKLLPLSKIGMQLTVFIVVLIAAMSVVEIIVKTFMPDMLGLVASVDKVLSALPFNDISMPWLVPVLVGITLSTVLPNKIKGEQFDM